jgi:hypothetical protein
MSNSVNQGGRVGTSSDPSLSPNCRPLLFGSLTVSARIIYAGARPSSALAIALLSAMFLIEMIGARKSRISHRRTSIALRAFLAPLARNTERARKCRAPQSFLVIAPDLTVCEI